ncbi:hypothetical protein F4554_001824 [Actinopolymorpha rutila]|uniref:Uncharacterized protein n=1 Tax=Actinopolymorpha rutila TaxID=446787 RepID=A0A852ZLA9_9ACTN|nr:hypothetical protein [Actinopolymorpha rutila]NYH89186.1 hypothetical protein [Actinopolymorpha rutila]
MAASAARAWCKRALTAPSAELLQPATGDVQRDSTQPRPEAARVGKSPKAHQCHDDRFLARVPGKVGVVQHAFGKPARLVAVAKDERGERRLVTCPRTDDQHVVRSVRHILSGIVVGPVDCRTGLGHAP